MGVSRFLDEALDRVGARPQPPLVLRGQAHGPVDPPWAAVLDAIGPLLAERPAAETDALLARDARPILLGLPGVDARAAAVAGPRASDLADPERRQPRALEALLRWLGRVAAERPIVIALEDLHAADAGTRAFATFVARIARDERIGLVLTYQPDRLTREHPLRENLAVIEAGLRPPVRIDLAPLARREIAGLIEGIDGERPSASIVVLVAERSAGSPLIVEELVAARRELRNATLTGSLADLVSARLARRSPECRRVLRILAPAERPMDRNRLARAAAAIEVAQVRGLPPRSTTLPRRGGGGLEADLAAGLNEALEHGFVRADADERLRIRHELVARAVVTDLLPMQRTRYRAALAEAFEDVPVVAAAHWRAAHRLTEARDASLAAGRIAMDVEAPQDAIESLELVLGLPATGDAGPVPPMPDAEDDRPAGDDATYAPDGRLLDGDRPARRGGRLRRDATDARRRLRGERARVPRRAARPHGVRGPPGPPRAVPRRRRGRRRGHLGAAQGGRRRALGALARPGPDPRPPRAGADDRRRVQRLGAGGLGGPPDRARPRRPRGAGGDPRHDDARGRPGLGRRPRGGRPAAAPGDRAGPRARPGRGVVAGRGEHGRRARAARAPGRGDRPGLPRHGRGAGHGPRRRVREPARRQRRRHPRGRGSLARGPRAEPARARLEPGRRPVRQRDPQPRHRRDRVGGGGGGGPPAGPRAGRARDRRRLPVRGAGVPGDGVVRDVERRPRRRAPRRRARLDPRPRHGGLGPDGPDGGDRARGRVRDRGRGPREAPDRRRRRVTRAGRADPRRGRRRGRAGAGRRRRRSAAPSPTRASRPPAPSTAGCRAATTRRRGPSWRVAGTTSATRTGRAARAGARPRRSSAARPRASRGARRGPTRGSSVRTRGSHSPRPSSSPCACMRDRCCARCASSPDAR